MITTKKQIVKHVWTNNWCHCLKQPKRLIKRWAIVICSIRHWAAKVLKHLARFTMNILIGCNYTSIKEPRIMYRVKIRGSTEGNEINPHHLENHLQKKHNSEMVVNTNKRNHFHLSYPQIPSIIYSRDQFLDIIMSCQLATTICLHLLD